LEDYVLEVKYLSKTYSGIKVLNDVSFALKKGVVHALVGENGAGKSTMIKIIAGVVIPDEGSEIIVEGTLINKMTANKSISLGISVIYQDISLFPNLTIAENICKGMFRNVLFSQKKNIELAKKALETMNVDLNVEQILSEVSIGKQQLVAIARAITFNSKVIVMDEPTSALSSSEVEILYNVIKRLKVSGASIIYISHKLDEVFTVADEITVLRDGNLVITGSISEFNQQKLINYMVGRELLFVPMRNEKTPSEEILFEVRGLTNEPYFRDISFHVMKNEILGITGLVGAGRSETAQTIFGLMPAQNGEVFVHGKKISPKNASEAIKNGICYLPEDKHTQGLFKGHTMIKNVTIVTLKKFLNRFKLLDYKLETDTARSYITKLSIRPNLPRANVESFSGGNQQKVLLARWLNADPLVLIVDEPTVGVDVGAKLEIHRLLRELASSGVCVVLISSDLPEVLAISDRILVMKSGRIVFESSAVDATQEKILEKGLMGEGA